DLAPPLSALHHGLQRGGDALPGLRVPLTLLAPAADEAVAVAELDHRSHDALDAVDGRSVVQRAVLHRGHCLVAGLGLDGGHQVVAAGEVAVQRRAADAGAAATSFMPADGSSANTWIADSRIRSMLRAASARRTI